MPNFQVIGSGITPPPNGSHEVPDRSALCEEMIDPIFSRLLRDADAAGWHPAEVISAMLASCADHSIRLLDRELTRTAFMGIVEMLDAMPDDSKVGEGLIMSEPSTPPDRSSATDPERPRTINIHRRRSYEPCRTTINGQHYYGATMADILARFVAAGLGQHAVSDQGITYKTVADALVVAKSAYQMQYRTGITPQSLTLVIDLLGGCVVAYSKGNREGRQIVFADRRDGLLADAHVLPARRGSAAKRDALEKWQRMVPDPTPTFESALDALVAEPTADRMDMLRISIAI